MAWQREAGRFALEVSVPQGTTAQVFLPGSDVPETIGRRECTAGASKIP